LKFNTATSFGGACYVESDGEAVFNGTEIFSNRAGNEGGGVYSNGTLYNEETGNIYSTATLDFLESQNDAFSDFGEETSENSDIQNFVVFGILATLFGILVIVSFGIRPKQKFKIKK